MITNIEYELIIRLMLSLKQILETLISSVPSSSLSYFTNRLEI